MRESKVGRPREFDLDQALDTAMVVFWRQGFEGASLSDLTREMGISRKSLYAAFGAKENLFRLALQRYDGGPAAYVLEALQAPTAKQVAADFLSGAAGATTLPDFPAGCLGVQGALAVGGNGDVIRDLLAEWRNHGQVLLRERFDAAVADGDLPPGADTDSLARYVMTIGNGIAVQAASGSSREQLLWVADAALRQWPPV